MKMISRKALIAITILASILIAAWFGRVHILKGALDVLILEDHLQKADVIVVLGDLCKTLLLVNFGHCEERSKEAI